MSHYVPEPFLSLVDPLVRFWVKERPFLLMCFFNFQLHWTIIVVSISCNWTTMTSLLHILPCVVCISMCVHVELKRRRMKVVTSTVKLSRPQQEDPCSFHANRLKVKVVKQQQRRRKLLTDLNITTSRKMMNGHKIYGQ